MTEVSSSYNYQRVGKDRTGMPRWVMVPIMRLEPTDVANVFTAILKCGHTRRIDFVGGTPRGRKSGAHRITCMICTEKQQEATRRSQ